MGKLKVRKKAYNTARINSSDCWPCGKPVPLAVSGLVWSCHHRTQPANVLLIRTMAKASACTQLSLSFYGLVSLCMLC